MNTPPRPLARLVVVLVALGPFLAWDQTREWPVHANPDSANYVYNYDIRGWVYPLLIDLVVPEPLQDRGTAPGFEGLVLAQRLIMLAALGVLFWVTSRRGLLVPLGVVFGAVLFDTLLVGDSFALMNHWIGSINPESLVYPWAVVLFVLAWTSTESPTHLRLAALGVWAALGVDLVPRLLPFSVMTLTPAAGAWVGRRSGSRVRPALLAFVVCVALVGLRCTATYAKAGVFSPVPYNGFSTIGVALQFADAKDARLFESRREKRFLLRSLRDRRRVPSHPVQGDTFETSFINMNTWVIAWPNYRRIWQDPGTDDTVANRILADIARTLLFSDGENFRRWMSWSAAAYAHCFVMRWHTTILALVSLNLAMLLGRRAPPPLVAMLLMLPVAHVANIVMTIPIQGIHLRYVVNGEFLLLGLFGVVVALAGGVARAPGAARSRLPISANTSGRNSSPT